MLHFCHYERVGANSLGLGLDLNNHDTSEEPGLEEQTCHIHEVKRAHSGTFPFFVPALVFNAWAIDAFGGLCWAGFQGPKILRLLPPACSDLCSDDRCLFVALFSHGLIT